MVATILLAIGRVLQKHNLPADMARVVNAPERLAHGGDPADARKVVLERTRLFWETRSCRASGVPRARGPEARAYY